MADFADRSLGIGYLGGSSLLFTTLMLVLGLWWLSVGSVSVNDIHTPKVELFYWVTILFSNTLGTALGDFLADTSGLGYGGGAIVFSLALLGLAVLYFQTALSRTFLFWAAFILTRPLGATVGDLFTKPFANGGLHFSRITSSLILVGCMGIFHMCLGFSSLAGSVVAGLLWDSINPKAPFILGGSIALLAVLLFLLSHRQVMRITKSTPLQ